jgi:FemAB-related protein (PEP-CTERM system-associated)
LKRETRNLILGDTPNRFVTSHPDATPEQLAHIQDLARQYLQLTDARKQSKKRAGQASRRIGETRSRGDDTRELKSTMHECSRELADIDNSLHGIEQQIEHLLDTLRSRLRNPKPASTTRYPCRRDSRGNVSVALLQNETDEWNEYALGHPASSIYHRAEWRKLIEETFGHSSYYCIARNSNGDIVGILPMIRLTSLLFGDFMVSVPYFNYGGPLGDNADIEKSLISFAGQLASTLGVSHIEYRDDVPRDDMPCRSEKVNMVLSLPENEQLLWESFSSKLRSQIRRSQRENPQLLFGEAELLDDFYNVFSRNMRDLGTPVYGKYFFRNILTTFPGDFRIIVVKLGNRPVAAGFLALSGGCMEIPWASTIRDVNHLSINMLLYWEALKYAIAHGCSSFDFGRSTLDSGTYRFKKQWGALPQQLYWHYWLGSHNEMPALQPSNPKYKLLIKLWKLLPLAIANRLGPMIVKNLP